jgi:starch phosphorylase
LEANLVDHWFNIKIEEVDISQPAEIQVNQTIVVKAKVNLATLTPSDVQVELYQGSIDASGEIIDGIPVVMECLGQDQDGCSLYSANITYTASGLQGLSLRVLPKHEWLSSPYEPRLIVWADLMLSGRTL